jgi:crotonobetainyl-CoA:carnitine CoA-transferase CaiB-like acyl-CoA transferase
MSGAAGAALRVVEVSSGIAGAYCGWLLQHMGADIVRVGAGGPAVAAEGADPIALALAYYAEGKRAAPPEGAAEAVSGADLVITDDAARLASVSGRTIAESASRQPGTVFGIASVFGMTGPLADAPAVPLDAQAVASVAWALGEPGRPPLSIPPGILECQAGAHLAAACLMARLAGASPKSGQPGAQLGGQLGSQSGGRIVDIALTDVLASYVAVNCRFYIHHGMRWRRAGRRASDSGGAYPFVILPCADGAVCLSGRTRAEWERFVEAMGSPAWAREPRYQKLRAMGQHYPDEVDALVAPWLSARTKAEIEEIADRFRLTIAPLRDLADVLATPQLAHRAFLQPFTAGGRSLLGPGLPFRVAEARGTSQGADLAAELLASAGGTRHTAGGTTLSGPAGSSPFSGPAGRSPLSGHAGVSAPPGPAGVSLLAGLRVLDLGWVWSAPQVGSILAQFGAEVIKVEHGQRPDNSRLSGAIIRDGRRVEGQTTDMSPMFHQINKGKLGVTLNLKEAAGVDLLKRLAAISDVVLENMSAGTLERSGIGYDVLSAANPRLVMVAMSGAGQFGPLSDMRTYAPAMSSFAGLESLVGYAGELPTGALNFAIGDPNAAIHGLVALFAALERRETSGRGCYIDLSQTEALLATLTPYLLQAQVEERQPPPPGNAHPAMAPHGIFPAAGDDCWLSIAVRDERDWAALAALAGAEEWARDPQFSAAAGRIACREALDGMLAGWTAGQDRDRLVAALREAGVPASPVNDIDALWADQQLAARGMADVVELPGLGQEALFRAPWNVSGFAVATGTRGPVLGEHNERVLRRTLGLAEGEFDRLRAEGVIA